MLTGAAGRSAAGVESDPCFVLLQTPGLTHSGTKDNTLQICISTEQPAGSSQLASWPYALINAACELLVQL